MHKIPYYRNHILRSARARAPNQSAPCWIEVLLQVMGLMADLNGKGKRNKSTNDSTDGGSGGSRTELEGVPGLYSRI